MIRTAIAIPALALALAACSQEAEEVPADGEVASPDDTTGDMTIDGDYTQHPDGTLAIELGEHIVERARAEIG